MATMRTRWSLRTFFTHIGQAVYQPETSCPKPTSEQGANKLATDSVVTSNPHPDNLPTQPTAAASSKAKSGHVEAAIHDQRSDSPILNHDDSQDASCEEVRITETRERDDELGPDDAPTTRASKGGDQGLPNSSKPLKTPKAYFDLPLEIRQQILSYVVDPEDFSTANAAVTLTHRSAVILSQVSHQARMDMKYVHFQWQQKHRLQDIMNCPIWTNDDQRMFDELSEMIGYHRGINRTRAQMDFVGAPQICQLLQTLDTFRAQKLETKNLIDQLKTTIRMQRDVNRELREDNEKLVLALEMRGMELGLEEN